MANKMEKCMKKLTVCDMWCIKASTIAFTLFLLTVWPALHNFVMQAHWGWYLAATVILAYKPFMKYMKA
jgi:hypothetical protein